MRNKIVKTHSQMVTESRQRLYDQIQFNVPKGTREQIKAIAAQNGESVNEYIRRLIAADMERNAK